jgi:hypothetical protein
VAARGGEEGSAGVPPGAQALLGGIRADRALVQAHLEQEAVRLADLAAGRDAEDLLDPVAVELGADGVELLLRGELVDAPLDVVVRPRSRAAFFALRVVTSARVRMCSRSS